MNYEYYTDQICDFFDSISDEAEVEQLPNFQFRIRLKSRLLEGMTIPINNVSKFVGDMEVSLPNDLPNSEIDRLVESCANASEVVYNALKKHGIDPYSVLKDFYIRLG